MTNKLKKIHSALSSLVNVYDFVIGSLCALGVISACYGNIYLVAICISAGVTAASLKMLSIYHKFISTFSNEDMKLLRFIYENLNAGRPVVINPKQIPADYDMARHIKEVNKLSSIETLIAFGYWIDE